MSFSKKVLLTVISVTLLQGCSTKQGTGTLLGGLAGAALGSQFGKGGGQIAAIAGGAILGGLIGGSIGKNMDETDKKLAELSAQKALETAPSGSSVAWKNPDKQDHHGSITPTKTYKNNEGAYCREYTQKVYIGGEEKKAYGTACRKPDGQWEIQN